MQTEKSIVLFSEIVGHTDQIVQLQTMLSCGSVPHALLFSGPEGVGKRRIARALASLLISPTGAQEWKGLEPASRTADLVMRGSHPDLHLLSLEAGKKDISVEQVRRLCAELHLKPYSSCRPVAVIDNAHCLSIAAANALLMTLEEPAGAGVLILLSNASHRLPETIVSRCQVVHFGYLSDNSVAQLLRRILDDDSPVQGSITRLVGLACGTLEPLGISQFVDPLSLAVPDMTALEEHLQALCRQAERLEEDLNSVWSSGSQAVASALAAKWAAEKELEDDQWRALFRFLRQKLRCSPPGEALNRADLLLEGTEALMRVRERNTALAIELACIFSNLERHAPLGNNLSLK